MFENKKTASYYIYSDGTAHWGLALIKNGEFPLECKEEQYRLDQVKRAEWYVNTTEELRKKQLEAEAKAKSK